MSQNPQAIKNRLSTVVMKQLERIRTFWLKLSPRWRRARKPLWLVTVAFNVTLQKLRLGYWARFNRFQCGHRRLTYTERGPSRGANWRGRLGYCQRNPNCYLKLDNSSFKKTAIENAVYSYIVKLIGKQLYTGIGRIPPVESELQIGVDGDDRRQR